MQTNDVEDPKKRNIGCSPPDFPTAEYIARYADVYNNPNIVSFYFTYVMLGKSIKAIKDVRLTSYRLSWIRYPTLPCPKIG